MKQDIDWQMILIVGIVGLLLASVACMVIGFSVDFGEPYMQEIATLTAAAGETFAQLTAQAAQGVCTPGPCGTPEP